MHRAALQDLNRALLGGATETSIESFWNSYQIPVSDAIAQERELLSGWERKLDEFFTLRGWGITAGKGVGSFLVGLGVSGLMDDFQAEILEQERKEWEAFYEKELEASLSWSAMMRASCIYWALVDEEEFLAGEYDAFLSSFDPSKDFLATTDETFTDKEELVLTVPFDGEGGFRVEVTVAGIRGEPRGDQSFVFPAGSFGEFEDGTELEFVVEVLPE